MLFIPLGLLNTGASSVSKTWPGSGLLPSAEPLGSGSPLWSLQLHHFSVHAAFILLLAAAPVHFPE